MLQRRLMILLVAGISSMLLVLLAVRQLPMRITTTEVPPSAEPMATLPATAPTPATLREAILQVAARSYSSEVCMPPVSEVRYGTEPDPAVSQRLQILYAADQAARSQPASETDWAAMSAADQQRRAEVLALLQAYALPISELSS